MAEIKKGYAKFNLVGQVSISDKTFEIDSVSKNNKDYIYNRLNLGVNCGNVEGKDNFIYATILGGYDSKKLYPIKRFGKIENDNGNLTTDYSNRIEIPFKERLTNSQLADIGDNQFISIGIVKDDNDKTIGKKFIHEYDAIKYIRENLQEDSIVNIKGEFKYSEYNGEISISKVIKSIWLSNAEKKDFRATFEQSAIFDNQLQGKIDEEGYLDLYGYVVDYEKETKSNVCHPFTIAINTKEYPLYDTIIKKYLKPDKKDNINIVGIQGEWSKGNAVVDVKMEDFSEDIQESIKCGMLTLEQAKGQAIGHNKSTTRTLFKRILMTKNKNNIDTFAINRDYKVEDMIFPIDKSDVGTAKSTEQPQQLFEQEQSKANYVKKTEVIDNVIDDIFGDNDIDDFFK